MVNKKSIIEMLEKIPVSAKTRNLIFHLNESIKEIDKIKLINNNNNKEKKKDFQEQDFRNLNKSKYDQILNKIDSLIQEEESKNEWDLVKISNTKLKMKV